MAEVKQIRMDRAQFLGQYTRSILCTIPRNQQVQEVHIEILYVIEEYTSYRSVKCVIRVTVGLCSKRLTGTLLSRFNVFF